MARLEPTALRPNAGLSRGPAGGSSPSSARARPISSTRAKVPQIVIVGGGFSGTAVAYHLLRALRAVDATVTIVEPRRNLGAGLAYSTEDPTHRINVPADRMSLDPEDGSQFMRWLESSNALAADPQALISDGRPFPNRCMFGRYVQEQISPWLVSGRLDHVRGYIVRLERFGKRYLLQTSDERILVADVVVLAVCHPSPALPIMLSGEFGNSGVINDPWRPDALAAIKPDDRVLIIGTGLTMADIVASLDARQHRGLIVAFSRRGLRSRGHTSLSAPRAHGDFTSAPASSALELLRRVRNEIAEARRSGFSWHATIDALRAQGSTIWAALPLPEKRRLLRHLRPYWDAHRFRIAPQTEAVLDKRIADGSLQIKAAKLISVERNGPHMDVALRRRSFGEIIRQQFEALVVATGPDHRAALRTDPLLRGMAELGLVQADPTDLGLHVDHSGRAIDMNGDLIKNLFVAGPLARGTFGELMGIPEVSRYAATIAGEVTRLIRGQVDSSTESKTDTAQLGR